MFLAAPATMLAVQQHPAAYVYWQGVGHLSFSAAAQVVPVCPHWHSLATTPDPPSLVHPTSSRAPSTLINTAPTAVAPLTAAPSQPQPSAVHVELEMPIGYGSFGVVWYGAYRDVLSSSHLMLASRSSPPRSVQNPHSGQRAALKRIPQVAQSLLTCIRTFREIKILCELQHDNVIPLPSHFSDRIYSC